MKEHQIGDLYGLYRNYLFTVIQQQVFEGCPQDIIYDLLDDVFTIALEKKDDDKFNADPPGWLVITSRHVVENFNRKYANRLRFYNTNFDFNLYEPPTEDNLLDNLALKIAVTEQVWNKIYNTLNRDERVFLVMRYYQKKGHKEIAKELHMSEGAVKVRISRLKKKITKLVYKHIGEN